VLGSLPLKNVALRLGLDVVLLERPAAVQQLGAAAAGRAGGGGWGGVGVGRDTAKTVGASRGGGETSIAHVRVCASLR
jgi:hypothetical protein